MKMKNKHAVALGKLGGEKSGGKRPGAGRPKLPVIHIPGKPTGDKQQCTRCGSWLNRYMLPEVTFWSAGVDIISHGRGSMGVATAEEIASVRFCGSKKEVSK
jgi:hypothetical protein